MNHIEELLIRNGIDPTVVDPSDKHQLTVWLSEAEQGQTSSFVAFSAELCHALHAEINELIRLAEQILSLTQSATDAIEPLLVGYPEKALLFGGDVDPRTMTARHVKLLTVIEEVKDNVEQLSALPPRPHSDQFVSLLTRLALRKVALSEGQRNEALYQHYIRLSEEAKACIEAIEAIGDQLTASELTLHGLLSELAQSASSKLADVNRKKAPQTEYFRILQQFALRVHDLSQAIKQIQKEASHVQISDGI